ncbi:MAG: ATP-binding cassette domain-containing protein [Clostridia bacterium]|nr:ATP-binding cassette domain-containing protein [Clostridia bacterium]
MIEVKNLCKKYADKIALNSVNFSVNKGEILGFLGPNGAGKTTTMNIITGYLSADEGTVTIDGAEIFENPIRAKSKIGYLPEIPPLYLDMPVYRYLEFIYELKRIKLNKKEHLYEICNLLDILDVKDRIIKNLSKGYKQRIGFAAALVGYPPVLILDEPTVGLDPKQITELREFIKKLGKNHTVILSSHILSEVQALCDRIVVINNGKIVADDTSKNLSENFSDKNKILVQIEGEKTKIRSLLSNIKGIKSVSMGKEVSEDIYEFTVNAGRDINIRKDIFDICAKNRFPILLMKLEETNLEDIFLQLTSDDANFAMNKGLQQKESTAKKYDKNEEAPK